MDFVARNIFTALVVVLPMSTAFAQGVGVSAQNPTNSVAVALHDKDAYLHQQYSPDTLPKNVFDAITQHGAKPVGFKRISIESKVVVDKMGVAVPVSSESESIYENAGNGFVRQVGVTKLNGFEQSYFFALNYRGVMALRAQGISVNATTMPPIADTISVNHIDGSVEGSHFSYAATETTNMPGSATIEVRYDCSAGKSYPASQINPMIQGPAHDVECHSLNVNGVVIGITRYGYLEKYGVAVLIHSKNPSLETSKTVTSFKEE
ncbi:hypothetical protein DEO45_13825 [Rhodanobacter denitrificans]|uniref:Uncharacterized protein n=2 Tax=Rhodanobacter denitrificans TaxID=666685 RepID=A0A368KDE5_9GAMM|nr:hypothetical protein DEO45_13825 [Rhodanobacter denitrificans]